MSTISESTLGGGLELKSVFFDLSSGKEYQIIGCKRIAELGQIVEIRNVGKGQHSKPRCIRTVSLEDRFLGLVGVEGEDEASRLKVGQWVGLLVRNENEKRRMFLKTDEKIIPFLDSLD